MEDPAATVFVVDDDAAVRDSLKTLLSAKDLRVETFARGKDFLARYRSGRGCVLLDMRMPDMDGLSVQRELNRRACSIPVIFITGNADVPHAVKALKSGAMDYLEKPLNRSELIQCIERALALDNERRTEAKNLEAVRLVYAALTPREREVMALLARGMSSKEIGVSLSLSHRTVEGYRSRIKEKVNARSLSEMITLARQFYTEYKDLL